MKMLNTTALAGALALALTCAVGASAPALAKPMAADASMAMRKPDMAMVMKITANWPVKIKETLTKAVAKYGMPTSVTMHDVTWNNADMSNASMSPFMMVRIKDTETPHDFPVHHTDFMKHTISYAVPVDKASMLDAFDGSVTFARTRGELSAECDTPEHNILALNLANDIVTGKRDVAGARAMYADTIAKEMKGEKPAYEQRLMFSPPSMVGDADMMAGN